MKKLILKVLSESTHDHALEVAAESVDIIDSAIRHVKEHYKNNKNVLRAMGDPVYGVIGHAKNAMETLTVDRNNNYNYPASASLNCHQIAGHMISELGRHLNDPKLELHGTRMLQLHTHLNFNNEEDLHHMDVMQAAAKQSLSKFNISVSGT